MQALPTPQSGGSIETLRRLLTVQGDNDFILVVAWALAVLRSLLDPNTAPLHPSMLI